MAQITRAQAIAALVNGAKPDQDFFGALMSSLVFTQDDLRQLFIALATQLDAENGTDNERLMTPLRVLQSVNKNAVELLRGGVSMRKAII